MSDKSKPEFKIQLNSHAEYLKAYGLLTASLGYTCPEQPYTCQFLYAHADGRLGVDYFDTKGSDTNSPNSALGCFNAHASKQISMEELEAMAEYEAVWGKAPESAFVWERFPNGKCLWHCKDATGKSFDKKAPNFEFSTRNSLWRDPVEQEKSDQMKANINEQLKKRNIVLA